MANEEQLKILKQGSKVWNEWRENNTRAEIDLENADLNGVNLEKVELWGANLSGANLTKVDFEEANLFLANLSGANLTYSNLGGVDFRRAVLQFANFGPAQLSMACLSESNLFRTNFRGADVLRVEFCDVAFVETDFSNASMGGTIFGNSDLSGAIGLDSVLHFNPSHISTDTIVRSKGNIPKAFLRGCGLSDWEIESALLYNPELNNMDVNKILYRMYDLRANQALQISPLFISYSHGDSVFVDKLESYLNKKGVRFWRDIHDMKSGRMEKQIDRALSLNPTALLILSEHSIQSDWVEHEVRTARSLEKELKRDVLCPVALDGSWKKSSWAKRIMEQIMEYNILDFSEWKDDTKFESKFIKLIDGLELFYR